MRRGQLEGAEYFRDLLLRHRGRTRLTQRQLAQRIGLHVRSVQDWENGTNYPSADRLEALIRLLVEAHGFTSGHETAEAQALWAAVEREAPRTRAPFDDAWFARLLAEHAAPAPAAVRSSRGGPVERRQDWGNAPDTTEFVGRTDELALLCRSVVEERSRLLAILGMGGIGKTALTAQLAHNVEGSFERIYWRGLRDAPLPSDWLAHAIGFLSDQQLVPPTDDPGRLVALLQLLRDQRCLLVLDNFETLFESGRAEGRYREGLAGYGRLIQAVGEASHQSCLILTSREA